MHFTIPTNSLCSAQPGCLSPAGSDPLPRRREHQGAGHSRGHSSLERRNCQTSRSIPCAKLAALGACEQRGYENVLLKACENGAKVAVSVWCMLDTMCTCWMQNQTSGVPADMQRSVERCHIELVPTSKLTCRGILLMKTQSRETSTTSTFRSTYGTQNDELVFMLFSLNSILWTLSLLQASTPKPYDSSASRSRSHQEQTEYPAKAMKQASIKQQERKARI